MVEPLVSSFPWGKWSRQKWEKLKETDCPVLSSPTSRGEEQNRLPSVTKRYWSLQRRKYRDIFVGFLHLSVCQFSTLKHSFQWIILINSTSGCWSKRTCRCQMLLGLLTTWLGYEGPWTPESQEQFDIKILPFERMIQAFHQTGESKQGWKCHDNHFACGCCYKDLSHSTGKGKYLLCKLEKLNEQWITWPKLTCRLVFSSRDNPKRHI